MAELLATESTLLFDCERCPARGGYCAECFGTGRIGMSNPFRNTISIAHARALARIVTAADSLPLEIVLDGIDYLHSSQHFAPAHAARHWDCAGEVFEVLQGWAEEFLAADDEWLANERRSA